MTLTLDIPDDLAEQLQRIPKADLNNYAVSALRKQLEEDEDEEFDHASVIDPTDYPLSEDDIAAIREGLAELEAGLAVDGNTVMRNLFERVGLPYPPKASEK